MKNQRNAAFTLIELLVVIAIIAILAAILFPVFAQAKMAAKKAAAISQCKQGATAVILYTTDADDLGPLGSVPNLSAPVGEVRYRDGDSAAQSPAGWFNYPGATQEHALVWHNTTEPYRKNYDMLDVPGTQKVAVNWPVATTPQLLAPRGSNLTYNGFLQYWSFTAITEVSKTPLLWQGQGDLTRVGAAMANPRLACPGNGVCMFNPSGTPQSGVTYPNGNAHVTVLFLNSANYWMFGKGLVYTFTDTSAKVINQGNGNNDPYLPGFASTTPLVPFQFIDTNGKISRNFIRGCWVTPARSNGSNYTAAFIPNNTYANNAGICF